MNEGMVVKNNAHKMQQNIVTQENLNTCQCFLRQDKEIQVLILTITCLEALNKY